LPYIRELYMKYNSEKLKLLFTSGQQFQQKTEKRRKEEEEEHAECVR